MVLRRLPILFLVSVCVLLGCTEAPGSSIERSVAPEKGLNNDVRQTSSEEVVVEINEKTLLNLLNDLSIGSEYEELKKKFPTVTDLTNDVGKNNTEAKVTMNLYGQMMNGEFNYHEGKLVSHGFYVRGLHEESAKNIYEKAKNYLVDRHGEGQETEGPSRDAHEGYDWSIVWEKSDKRFSVFMSDIYDGYRVGWGAQK